MKDNAYFEAHVSITGHVTTGDEERDKFIAQCHGFWWSFLEHDTGDDEVGFILTSRDSDFVALQDRTKRLVQELTSGNPRHQGTQVTRYKIEKTEVDSKFGDPWGMLR